MKKLFLIIALILCLVAQVSAARLDTIGFELNSLTAGVELDGILAGTGSGISITTSPVHSGTYAFKSLNSNGTILYYKTVTASASGRTYYTRFYLYVTTAPTPAIIIFSFTDTVGTGGWQLLLNSNRTLQLQKFSNNANIGSASAALNTGQWYCIEVSYAYTGGATAARIDQAAAFASGTGDASIALATPSFGPGTSFTGEIEYDDIAINDDQGTAQNSWPGNGKVIHLHPAGAGESNSWLKSNAGAGDANNYNQVNGVTPDDATTYLESHILNASDLYTFGASGINSYDVVNVVQVGCRFSCSSTTTTGGFKLQIEKANAGTKSLSAEIVPNATSWKTNTNAVPWKYPLTLYLDPDNSVAWTQATLDTLRAGMICSSAGVVGLDYMSTVWVLVDYTTGTPPAGIKQGLW